MIPVEQGGCCLTRYDASSASHSNKRDHILARYRPIAPRPVAPKSELQQNQVPASSDLQSSSTTSAGSKVGAPGVGERGRRSRKRNTERSCSGRAPKKSPPQQQPVQAGYGDAGAAGAVSGRVHLGLGLGSDKGDGSVCSALTLSSGGEPEGGGGHFHVGASSCNDARISSDAAFMDRAAASGPSTFFPHLAPAYKLSSYSGGFSQMLRGITGSTDLARSSAASPSRPTTGSKMMAVDLNDALPDVDSYRPNLVTLSLLPETPAHPKAASDSASGCTSAGASLMGDGSRYRQDAGPLTGAAPCRDFSNAVLAGTEPDFGYRFELLRNRQVEHERMVNAPHVKSLLDTFRELVSKASAFACGDTAGRVNGESGQEQPVVVDVSYLEQAYAASCDPVMLTDENDVVLWFNSAFKRACSDRSSRQNLALSPYIDPLGVPTRLSSCLFQLSATVQCRGVLWGFLKKFVIQAEEEASQGAPPHPHPSVSEENVVQERNFLGLGFRGAPSSGNQDFAHKVIAPQAVRPVGSTVTLECVLEEKQFASPCIGNLIVMREQLDNPNSLPAMITDMQHRVRWVNGAYRQLVGQPECTWLASTVAKHGSGSVPQTRLTGEVSLVCACQQLPQASSFSGRARLQWMNGGQVQAVNATCDVTSFQDEQLGIMNAWRFRNATAAGLLPRTASIDERSFPHHE